MRKKRVKAFSELKDSKLLYEKDMPPFGYVLIAGVMALLIAVSVWGVSATKPYIVNAVGVLQGDNKNYVMSQYGGKIAKVNMKEGQAVKKGETLFTVSSPDMELQRTQLFSQKESFEKSIDNYSRLAEAILNDENYFSKSDDEMNYYSQYEAYENKIKQQVVDKAALKEYGYKKKQIQAEIDRNEATKKQIKYEAIASAEQGREQAKQQLDAINAQLEALEKGEKDYSIKAQTSGKLHLLGNYKDGMVVQAGSAIATISDDKENTIIEATVSASDRSRIEVGNDVNIEVAGLQQNIYGTLKGKVTKIDTDISMSEDGKESFFKIQVKPESTILKDKDGKEVRITNGMQVNARITYDKITYFDYVMDALGIGNI